MSNDIGIKMMRYARESLLADILMHESYRLDALKRLHKQGIQSFDSWVDAVVVKSFLPSYMSLDDAMSVIGDDLRDTYKNDMKTSHERSLQDAKERGTEARAKEL